MSVRTKFILIMILAALAAVLAWPREDRFLSLIGLKNTNLQIRQGLDLQGGAHLVYEAQFDKRPGINREQALVRLVDLIQGRINPAGTSEVVVQKSGSNRIIVELPGETDLESAKARIGKLAELKFLEVPAGSTDLTQAIPTDISGEDVAEARADIDTQKGEPVVRLQMKGGESTSKFTALTTRVNQSGNQLLTLLDGRPIFGPAAVPAPITDGISFLSGNFQSIQDAREVAKDINSGALPVPVGSPVEERTVGPTLGQDSVEKSLVAGILGLLTVAFFMVLYYRLAGAVAVVALTIYTSLLLSIIKLSAQTPSMIVLTLAGIAGFILSIGMAVDANILIFERFREEVRRGRELIPAMEAGFDRAWPSIKDSNISSLITTAILYFFSGTPIIRGFAVTLALGVVVSMFTALVVSRNLLRMLLSTKVGHNPRMYGIKAGEVKA